MAAAGRQLRPVGLTMRHSGRSTISPMSMVMMRPIARCAYSSNAPQYKYPVPLSPAVQVLLHANHIDAAQVTGTGPKGRILKGDVLQFLADGGKSKQPSKQTQTTSSTSTSTSTSTSSSASTSTPIARPAGAKPLSTGNYEDIPNSAIRKVIAHRLTESKQTVPHDYMAIDCCIDNTMSLRQTLNEMQKTKLSLNDFIIKALALALRDVPTANAAWKGDEIQLSKNVDISVAVATPKGLLTPIIKGADTKSVLAISRELKELAVRAKEGKLKPEEFQGGSATISNLGMFGIDNFSAVINPPQGVILAVGQGRKVLRFLTPEEEILADAEEAERANQIDIHAQEEGSVPQQEEGQEGEEQGGEEQEEEEEPTVYPRLKETTVMSATLSCDVRAIDEVTSAQLLDRVRHYLDQPDSLLL